MNLRRRGSLPRCSTSPPPVARRRDARRGRVRRREVGGVAARPRGAAPQGGKCASARHACMYWWLRAVTHRLQAHSRPPSARDRGGGDESQRIGGSWTSEGAGAFAISLAGPSRNSTLVRPLGGIYLQDPGLPESPGSMMKILI